PGVPGLPSNAPPLSLGTLPVVRHGYGRHGRDFHHHFRHLPALLAGPAASGGLLASAAMGSPLSSIPVLGSDPGASATLYLDFTGAAATSWGGYNVPATPAYDL